MNIGLTKFIMDLYEETSTGSFKEALDNISAEDIAKMCIADGIEEDVIYFIAEQMREGMMSDQSRFLKLENGTIWPDHESDVEWRLRYAPDRGAELSGASVCEAYRELISMPQSKRNRIISELRKRPLLLSEGREGDE